MPFISIDNKKIYYEISGNGPVIILHHGFSMWGKDWIKSGWIHELSKNFTCLIFDAIGHGNSVKPLDIREYTVQARTELVMELAYKFGWSKFSFLGFSMGGRIGYQLMSSYKENLDKVVVIAMHGFPPSQYIEQFKRRLKFINSNRIQTLERALGINNPDRPINDPKALSLSTKALFSWEGCQNSLNQNHIPALILCGTNDPIFKPTQQFSKLLSSSTFFPVLDDSHGGVFHRNQSVKDRVLCFFNFKSS